MLKILMPQATPEVIGRFAPSPSGGLHLGSICTAIASYLNVKVQNGSWLLRIDDLDKTREVKGATLLIIETIEALGLEWSGPIIYQNDNHEKYEEVIADLSFKQLLYPCRCTRKIIGSGRYPGTCRHQRINKKIRHSLRLELDTTPVEFSDLTRGIMQGRADELFGDFVVKRADGVYTYHLATVIDDEQMGITEVVRGDDLLGSTFPQIHLQRILKFDSPLYSHIPTVKDVFGIKLSKQTRAEEITPELAAFAIFDSFRFLGIPAPEDMRGEKPAILMAWACSNWDTSQHK